MKFAIVLGLLASVNSFAGVIYSNTTDVSAAAHSFKIWRAAKFDLATKTEVREIPGCNMETSYPCTIEIALERTPVLAVDVQFVDPALTSEGSLHQFVSFNLPVSDAGKKLNLTVKNVVRDITVEDARNSRYCQVTEGGELANPNCKDQIAYKAAKKTVKEVSVKAE